MMQVNTSFMGDERRSGGGAERKYPWVGGNMGLACSPHPPCRRLCADKFFGFEFPRKLASQKLSSITASQELPRKLSTAMAPSSRLYWKISYFARVLGEKGNGGGDARVSYTNYSQKSIDNPVRLSSIRFPVRRRIAYRAEIRWEWISKYERALDSADSLIPKWNCF